MLSAGTIPASLQVLVQNPFCCAQKYFWPVCNILNAFIDPYSSSEVPIAPEFWLLFLHKYLLRRTYSSESIHFLFFIYFIDSSDVSHKYEVAVSSSTIINFLCFVKQSLFMLWHLAIWTLSWVCFSLASRISFFSNFKLLTLSTILWFYALLHQHNKLFLNPIWSKYTSCIIFAIRYTTPCTVFSRFSRLGKCFRKATAASRLEETYALRLTSRQVKSSVLKFPSPTPNLGLV